MESSSLLMGGDRHSTWAGIGVVSLGLAGILALTTLLTAPAETEMYTAAPAVVTRPLAPVTLARGPAYAPRWQGVSSDMEAMETPVVMQAGPVFMEKQTAWPTVVAFVPALLMGFLAGMYSVTRSLGQQQLGVTDIEFPEEQAFAATAGKQRKARVSKSLKKRFKVTATGKLMHRRGGKTHLQQKKNHSRRRALNARISVPSLKMAGNLITRMSPH